MITDDIAYAEVFEILSYMNKKTVMKIPYDVLKFIKENRNKEYISKIDPNNIFNPDNISKEAKEILAVIDIEFLESEENKKEKLKIYKQNERKYQKETSSNYSITDIWNNKNKDNQKEIILNQSIQEYKGIRWYQKIIIKILDIFRKH